MVGEGRVKEIGWRCCVSVRAMLDIIRISFLEVAGAFSFEGECIGVVSLSFTSMYSLSFTSAA